MYLLRRALRAKYLRPIHLGTLHAFLTSPVIQKEFKEMPSRELAL